MNLFIQLLMKSPHNLLLEIDTKPQFEKLHFKNTLFPFKNDDKVRYLNKEVTEKRITENALQLFEHITSQIKNLNISSEKIDTLTKQESHIISHIGDGLQNKEIAEVMFISPHTVQTHRKNIYKKLEINSIAEVVKLSLLLKLF